MVGCRLFFLCVFLTLFRILSAPFFVFFYLTQVNALGLFLFVFVCEITDFLDGLLARKWKCQSPFGAILDPVSDSFWHLSVLFAFTQGRSAISIWIPLFSLWRDILVSFLRILSALNGIPFQVNKRAKVKSALWGISILLFLFGEILIEKEILSRTMFRMVISNFFILNCLLSWTTLFSYYVRSSPLLLRFFRNSRL
ncbi:CDP-alcohol phosphatidyltransferase family protein [Candidatus Similichlamydia epinepheli]|uniref:CDP-alcohol phosphatidyltransferase family protein n=1 Tax=Candidatus Similichlamydia epinepheli TaxID=1903953 RepID=UPI000D332D13|nr:CDP-alcohol phosphatidyltransferase family protein [Candidatus Similichlamydia epinepheli]